MTKESSTYGDTTNRRLGLVTPIPAMKGIIAFRDSNNTGTSKRKVTDYNPSNFSSFQKLTYLTRKVDSTMNL